MWRFWPWSWGFQISEVLLYRFNSYAACCKFGQYKILPKHEKLTETLAHGYSSEIIQRELSNEYQRDRVKMIFLFDCSFVYWMKVTSASEALKSFQCMKFWKKTFYCYHYYYYYYYHYHYYYYYYYHHDHYNYNYHYYYYCYYYKYHHYYLYTIFLYLPPCRQPTPYDSLCVDGPGSRIYGDCDALMREVMRHLLGEEEVQEWEEGREDRLEHYAKLRSES